MWHRYDSALRSAVLTALKAAAARGGRCAEPQDLVAALCADSSSEAAKLLQNHSKFLSPKNVADVAPALEVSDAALRVLECAYEEAASATAKQITREHVLIGLIRFGELKIDLTAQAVRAAMTQAAGGGASMLSAPAPSTASSDDAQLSAGNPQLATDPYPIYARLRELPSVRRDPLLPVWVVTGYDDVMSILRDARFTVRRRQSRTTGNTFSLDALPEGNVRHQLSVLASLLAHKMIFLDPPEHTRVRNQINQNFTPRACEIMRPRIAKIADDLLDRAARNGRAIDLIQDYALQLPIIVICEMIGLPSEDRVQLKHWADQVGNVIVLGSTIRHEVEARRGMIEFRAYFDRIMERVRAEPSADNLLGMLMRSGYPANETEQAELFANVVFLLGAGHETTTSLIGNGLRVLQNHSDQLQRLRDEPSLVSGAVEELLRYESPVQWTSRQALADVEIGGITIKSGESVLVSLGAANRDPKQFPDPDHLDIARRNASRHLAFSGGIHFCLGAALSRVEAQIGINAIISRMPNLHIDPSQSLQWKTGSTIRTLETLPATF
jgi:cytochrome P450